MRFIDGQNNKDSIQFIHSVKTQTQSHTMANWSETLICTAQLDLAYTY